MNILNEQERGALLRSLTDAPDEVLIDAVRQSKDWRVNIKNSFKEVQGFVGMKVVEITPPKYSMSESGAGDSDKKVDTDTKEVSHPTRPNMSPGTSAIGKIGGKTKEEIIRVLKMGHQPNHNKYGEHCKLLWSRGELCFDGKEYYLGK